MISQIPLEPMHLLDLSVTRKILLRLTTSDIAPNFKLNSADKIKISTHLISPGPFLSKEFARKPRSLEELLWWKSTEFKQFILYTGIIALKDVVKDGFYYCIVHIVYCHVHEVMKGILQLFVKKFPVIFKENSVTCNIHSLLHIVDCVRELSFIKSFAAYKFENYMQQLKKKSKNCPKC